LKREDGLIDWTMDAQAIERCVRGLQPWPNAYTSYKSRRLIIWEAQPAPAGKMQAGAGRILKAEGDDLIVSAGDATALRLAQVQMEGSRRMSARDFINGSHPQEQDLLG
jgi:methionyl-tRNA formyltransferase